MSKRRKAPAYCRCHRSGKAYILQRLEDGRLHRYYIGQWGTPRSLELYAETVEINLNVPEFQAAMRAAEAKVAAFNQKRQPQTA